MDRLKTIINYMPQNIKLSLEKLSDFDRKRIQEIRIRVNQYLHISVKGQEYILTTSGHLSNDSLSGIMIDRSQISSIFFSLCRHSVHSYEETIKRGYITVEGGCRIGIAGTANVKNDKIISMQYINGLNIRIAKEIKDSSYEIYNKIYLSEHICNANTLIAGKVNSGKTTILRDLCRLLSKDHKISLIDERNEISSSYNGVPQNDVGSMTDVLCNYPRHIGMETAVRTLSPEIVISDEIFSYDDVQAIEFLYGNGVNIIASTHANDFDDLQCKKAIYQLLDKKIFNYIVFLDNGENIGKIKDIVKL